MTAARRVPRSRRPAGQAPAPPHLSAEALARGPRDRRPVPRAPLGPHPALPPGPGAGRVADPRGHGRHRRPGRGRPRPRCSAPPPSTTCCTPSRWARYLVAVCTNIACLLDGAAELLEHAEGTLGIGVGGTTADGVVTLEEAECLADCDRAPCVQVNHRFVGAQTPESFDRLVAELRSGARDSEIPPHGTLNRVRADRRPRRPTRSGWPPSGPRWPAAAREARRRRQERGAMPEASGSMTITDAPKIVTARLDHDDSHTLQRYLATGGYDGLAQGAHHDPRGGGPRGRPGQPARPGRRRLPGRPQVGDAAEEPGHLPGGQRRRERAGHLQGPPAHRAGPPPAHRGRGHRRLRPAGHPGLHLHPRRVRPRPRAGPGRPQRRLRPRRGGPDIFGSGFSVDVVVHPGAGAYICGEETALLESLEGKRGFPRIKPPYFPAAIGLYGEPTVVNNVETMSNLPWIVLHGGAAFAALGEGRSDRDPAVRPGRPRQQPRRVRGRDGQDHLPRPHQRPRARRWRPARPGASRRSSPAVSRPPGSGPSRSTCRSARTRWGRPARCSARGRSW